ncbi:MAG: efflux RND transporter permease subunit [Desulfobacterales bacterium]
MPLAMFSMSFTFLKIPDPNAALWTMAGTTALNIYSQVGLVTLIGLVSENGILIVEFANQLQLQGRSKYEAVHEAAATRLRPILTDTDHRLQAIFPHTGFGRSGSKKFHWSGDCGRNGH